MNTVYDKNKEAGNLLPKNIAKKFSVFNYNHAAEILSQSFPVLLHDVISALEQLKITKTDILQSGGNESPIPPKFSAIFEPAF